MTIFAIKYVLLLDNKRSIAEYANAMLHTLVYIQPRIGWLHLYKTISNISV